MEEDEYEQDLFTFQPVLREWFNKGHNYKVSSFNITDRTAFILSDQGELTAEDEQRTSKVIAQASRHGQTCTSTFLTVCKVNCTMAFVSLTYAPAPSEHGHNNKRAAADVIFVRRSDAASAASSLTSSVITQLSGSQVTAAAWLGQQVLLATAEGLCHIVECATSAQEQPSFTVRPRIFSLHAFRKAITSISVINDTYLEDEEGGEGPAGGAAKRCILMSTANALFCFTGEGSLGAILAQYDSPSSAYKALAIELPAETCAKASKLAFREGIVDRDVDTQQLAWLTQSTLIMADLDVRPGVIDGGWDLIVKRPTLLHRPLSELVEGSDVLGVSTTQWHVLLLECGLPGGGLPRVAVINRITGRCVSRLTVPSALSSPFGLYFDPVWEEAYICGAKGYTQITEHTSSDRIWQDFLALERFEEALQQTEGVADATARVLLRWGEKLLRQEKFEQAAEKLGAISAEMAQADGIPTFTELVLRFYPDPGCSHLDAAKARGLERYLETKLAPFRNKQQPDANASAIATWMLELLCDRLTHAVMESSHASSPAEREAAAAAVAALEQKLAGFITAYAPQLEYNVLINNLDSFGRVKEMKLAARNAGRWHELLGYHLSQGEVKDALELLEKLEGLELEVAMSELMRLDAAATCHALATFQGLQAVEPDRILRAVAQFSTSSSPPALREHVIALLHHLIYGRQSQYPELHNCYVSLLAMDADPTRLVEFMDTKEAASAANPNAYVFDPIFALNVAKEHGNVPACIKLMMGLNMLEDAVQLASTYEERLRIIHEVRGKAMQQKLWRKVVEMEVRGARERAAGDRETIFAITRCVNDSRETLRIEDVLHLFPHDATIADYKEPLLEHMEAASRRVEQMKQDTAAATRMSATLQAQLQELQDVKGSISLEDHCSSCGVKLGARPVSDLPFHGAVPPFIVYPSGGKYHTVCAVHRLMQASGDEAKNRRLRRLLADLSSVPSTAAHVVTRNGGTEAVQKLQGELHRELQDGDPMNSEAVVKLIEQLLGGDQAAAASWEVPLTVF